VWLYFKKKTNLFDGYPKKVLHVAAEPVFEKLLKKCLGKSYLTADLNDPRAMVKMDICNIQYPRETCDVIYCSHVLEHVQNDKEAIQEFHRVLKSEGWAMLLVPLSADKTYEYPSVTDPSERLKLFGQEDHVRRYGPDYTERLREVGFNVEVTLPSDFLSMQEIIHMGITKEAGEIYYLHKAMIQSHSHYRSCPRHLMM